MASAMQLYAGFALLVIAIVAIITIVALVSNLIGAMRRRFGGTRRLAKTRAHDDLPRPRRVRALTLLSRIRTIRLFRTKLAASRQRSPFQELSILESAVSRLASRIGRRRYDSS